MMARSVVAISAWSPKLSKIFSACSKPRNTVFIVAKIAFDDSDLSAVLCLFNAVVSVLKVS